MFCNLILHFSHSVRVCTQISNKTIINLYINQFIKSINIIFCKRYILLYSIYSYKFLQKFKRRRFFIFFWRFKEFWCIPHCIIANLRINKCFYSFYIIFGKFQIFIVNAFVIKFFIKAFFFIFLFRCFIIKIVST